MLIFYHNFLIMIILWITNLITYGWNLVILLGKCRLILFWHLINMIGLIINFNYSFLRQRINSLMYFSFSWLILWKFPLYLKLNWFCISSFIFVGIISNLFSFLICKFINLIINIWLLNKWISLNYHYISTTYVLIF